MRTSQLFKLKVDFGTPYEASATVHKHVDVLFIWLTLVFFFCVLQRELGHYYGYVYFRQVRDKSLKRGYFQKVSERLFVSLILDLVHLSTVVSALYVCRTHNDDIISGVGVGA